MNKNLLLILIILVVIAVLFSFFPAFAQESVQSASNQRKIGISKFQSLMQSPSIPTPKAVLVNSETGQRIELPLEFQQNIIALDFKETLYQNQYDVLVPISILASNMNEKSKWDKSYAVYGTIRQYYNETYYGNNRYVSVSQYQARWILYDSSVKMSNAKILVGCYGEFWDGGECKKWETKSIGIPSSGKWYTEIPSWAGRYVFVAECCFQAGRSEVTLKRGSSTWKLEICVDEGNGC